MSDPLMCQLSHLNVPLNINNVDFKQWQQPPLPLGYQLPLQSHKLGKNMKGEYFIIHRNKNNMLPLHVWWRINAFNIIHTQLYILDKNKIFSLPGIPSWFLSHPTQPLHCNFLDFCTSDD